MSITKWRVVSRPIGKISTFLQLAHAVVKATKKGKAVRVGFAPSSSEYNRLAKYLINHRPPLGIRSKELDSGKYAVWGSEHIRRHKKRDLNGRGIHHPSWTLGHQV